MKMKNEAIKQIYNLPEEYESSYKHPWGKCKVPLEKGLKMVEEKFEKLGNEEVADFGRYLGTHKIKAIYQLIDEAKEEALTENDHLINGYISQTLIAHPWLKKTIDMDKENSILADLIVKKVQELGFETTPWYFSKVTLKNIQESCLSPSFEEEEIYCAQEITPYEEEVMYEARAKRFGRMQRLVINALHQRAIGEDQEDFDLEKYNEAVQFLNKVFDKKIARRPLNTWKNWYRTLESKRD
jgi:hypothetical protein